MIVEAEKRGEIQPGDVLIEATSGNTGIALAMIAALKGYHMKLLMPDNMSQERRAAMRAYGAEPILVTKEQGMEGPATWPLRWRSAGEGKLLDQFNNPDNPYAHYTTTGPEIWQQTAGRITHFVSSMGTTGTITGVSRFCANRVNRWPLSAGSRKRAAVFPGSVAGRQSICRGSLTLRWWMRCWIFISRMPRIPCVKLAVREGIFCGVSLGGAWRARYALPVKILARWWWRSSAIAAIVTFPPACSAKNILARGLAFNPSSRSVP
ncbi:pyridoxal-phosphate dependent enzyme [Klebsiella variicola subsp. variicola]|nr:pyridoxal-phosphate dependent enzyme [Klebsiella variicola subsp. variicola]